MSNEDYTEPPMSLDTPVPAADTEAVPAPGRIHITRRIVKIQEYRCSDPKCRAVDFLKLTQAEVELSLPKAVNCWKCKGGLKKGSPDQMLAIIQSGKPCGMLPYGAPVDQDAGVSEEAKNEAREPMPEKRVLSIAGNGNNTPH